MKMKWDDVNPGDLVVWNSPESAALLISRNVEFTNAVWWVMDHSVKGIFEDNSGYPPDAVIPRSVSVHKLGKKGFR